MSDNKPALLALDWGSSALRAGVLAADGRVLAHRSRPWGILSLPDGGYPAAFAAMTADWAPWAIGDLPAIACGMVGSRQGWKQVDYLTLPCGLSGLGQCLDRIAAPDGRVLHLVPGLLDPSGPDVMRGEETEAVGAMEALGDPDGALTLVMPGTHSKWLHLSDRVLTGFTTYMTGELFAVLSRHSILGGGDLAECDTPGCETAFRDGVLAADADGMAARLFSTRARMLTGRLAAEHVPDFLSGLLIGEEVSRALACRPAERIVLIGAAALTRRYALAFDMLGRPVTEILNEAAMAGLHRIALSAGLIAPKSGEMPC